MREIEDIKNRMNRYKISCPIGKIEKALLNPIEDHPMHRDDLALPRPGSSLISNPKMKGKKGMMKKKRAKSKKNK